jgi:branched-chain amino acid aminotransferase
MGECSGLNYILNGELQPAALFTDSIVYRGESVYEVIRTRNGTPFFFLDHMNRLSASTRLTGKKILASVETIRNDIIKLSRADRHKEANLKIVFNYNLSEENYLIYFIKSFYPSNQQYIKGVKGILVDAERKDPASKVVNLNLKSIVAQSLLEENAYEAILVNNEGFITEGSRSNLFFIKNGELFTTPESAVLNGITRQQVLLICKEAGIKVNFMMIPSEGISAYEAAVMTGTSPLILPYYEIGKVRYRVDNPFILQLREMYLIRAEASLKWFNQNKSNNITI